MPTRRRHIVSRRRLEYSAASKRNEIQTKRRKNAHSMNSFAKTAAQSFSQFPRIYKCVQMFGFPYSRVGDSALSEARSLALNARRSVYYIFFSSLRKMSAAICLLTATAA